MSQPGAHAHGLESALQCTLQECSMLPRHGAEIIEALQPCATNRSFHGHPHISAQERWAGLPTAATASFGREQLERADGLDCRCGIKVGLVAISATIPHAA